MEPCYMHIDVNSAFLSWEAAYSIQHGDTLDLREIPSVVGGSQATRHGIVLAKSIPAKKQFGIKTGESLMEARIKAGNNLKVVPPNHEVYRVASDALMRVLSNYSPDIEKFSIDEAFLNYTGMNSLFGDPIERAYKIKDEIEKHLGFTVNIGVSTNKLLAKMACEFEKPNKVHSLWPEEIETEMWPLPIGELYIVGRKMSAHLANRGILTIGDLAKLDEMTARRWFKSNGVMLWNYANGRFEDNGTGGAGFFQSMTSESPKHKVKGIGNSGTIAFDIDKLDVAHQSLLSLSETVGYRLRQGGYSAKVMHVSYCTDEFKRIGKQCKFGAYTNNTTEIYLRVCKIFDFLWNGEKIRQVGIRATDLTQSTDIQTSFFNPIEKQEKSRELDQVIDSIRIRYGNDSILIAKFLDGQLNPMLGGTWGSGSYRPKNGLPL